jgi:hypothetical protein
LAEVELSLRRGNVQGIFLQTRQILSKQAALLTA